MPTNATLKVDHEQRLDTLTLGKVSDCCPHVSCICCWLGRTFQIYQTF